MKRTLIFGLTVLFMAIVLSGCCGGGKESVVIQPAGNGPTQGQQLQDLKAAHDKGAITDEEFEKAKEKILNP